MNDIGLKKDHILGTGATAIAGGALGGAIGALLGPGAMALAVVAGGALGATAGDQLMEKLDERGDIGHFEQVYMSMEHYVQGMTWEDYRPAYAYGIEHRDDPEAKDPHRFLVEWERVRGESRLSAADAWAAVFHVQRAYRLAGKE